MSDEFTFTVEDDVNGNPRILRIAETANGGDVLSNETWYSIRNANNGWACNTEFELIYAVVYGDANGDGITNVSDLNAIWNGRGPARCDADPNDITANGSVNVLDLNAAWPHRGSRAGDPPDGHGCPQ